MSRIPRAVVAVLAALSLLSLVPGVAFAAQPSCGDTLLVNTTLTADLDCSLINSDGLYLGADGVVLNLNGHTIWGFIGGEDKRGVYDAGGFNHTTVKNGTIRDFDIQYAVENGADNVARNLHLIGEAAEANDVGADMYYDAHTVLDNVEVDDASTGISFDSSAGGVVMNSDVSGADTAFDLGGTTGMLLTGNSAQPASGGTGFYEDYSAGSRYIANHAAGGDKAFDFECNKVGRVIVKNNTATDADYGFILAECYSTINDLGSIVTGNTATGNTFYGFQDYKSYNATWKYNVAKHNQSSGFFFDYPGGATVKFNVANRNDVYGFEIHNNGDDDNFVALSRNTASRNGSIGFWSYDYPSPGTGNVARHNLVQNCLQVSCVP